MKKFSEVLYIIGGIIVMALVLIACFGQIMQR